MKTAEEWGQEIDEANHYASSDHRPNSDIVKAIREEIAEWLETESRILYESIRGKGGPDDLQVRELAGGFQHLMETAQKIRSLP